MILSNKKEETPGGTISKREGGLPPIEGEIVGPSSIGNQKQVRFSPGSGKGKKRGKRGKGGRGKGGGDNDPRLLNMGGAFELLKDLVKRVPTTLPEEEKKKPH